jgi:hypothetical protein
MTASIVGLTIGFESRDRIDGSNEDIRVILRGIALEGRLSGYQTAEELPPEYRAALLKWLQER